MFLAGVSFWGRSFLATQSRVNSRILLHVGNEHSHRPGATPRGGQNPGRVRPLFRLVRLDPQLTVVLTATCAFHNAVSLPLLLLARGDDGPLGDGGGSILDPEGGKFI